MLKLGNFVNCKTKMCFWIVWQRNMKYSQKVWIFPSKLFENSLLRGIYWRTWCQAAGHVILLTRQKMKSPKKYNKSQFTWRKQNTSLHSLHDLQAAQSAVCILTWPQWLSSPQIIIYYTCFFHILLWPRFIFFSNMQTIISWP